MITASDQRDSKANGGLQLSALVGRGMQFPRHAGEVLNGTNPDQLHLGVPPQTLHHPQDVPIGVGLARCRMGYKPLCG
jgi:hypothetical protein